VEDIISKVKSPTIQEILIDMTTDGWFWTILKKKAPPPFFFFEFAILLTKPNRTDCSWNLT
jgi:hypothetical protein